MDNPNPRVTANDEVTKPPSPGGPLRSVQNLALAGIGIVGVLGDEAQNLYQRSVERGERMIQRLQERLPRAPRPRFGRPGGKAERPRQASDELDAALARLNIPTSADIDALTRQITELEAKIDRLNF